MSNPACILVYGRDASLLETRRMLLATTGFQVYATTEWEAAERVIKEEKPALFVLCYTLAPGDRSSILNSAERLYPEMRVLILTADGQPSDDSPEDTLNIFAGARAFKARVVELLRQRSEPRERTV